MNSRTIQSAFVILGFFLFLVTVAHVHAQQKTDTENVNSSDSKETYTQLPILTTDVGEPEKKPAISTQASEPVLTKSPSTTATPKPTSAPETKSISNKGGLDPEKLFNMSNEYRKERGLQPFTKDQKTCELAHSRAPEISDEVKNGNLHAGLQSRNLDYWNTENIISMSTEESAFKWWVNDKIHHDAIIGDFKYSCVACHGNSCAQEFTNYQSK